MDSTYNKEELEYRLLLLELSRKLTRNDIKSLAFLYSITELSDCLDIFTYLETQSVLSSSNLEGLVKVTEDLGRQDLARWLEDKVMCVHSSSPSTQHTVCSYYCNPQLKSHFESILPLSSLLINHTKTLRNVLVSIPSTSESQEARRGTGKINHYLQSAELKLKEAEQDLLLACRKAGYWLSGDKLEPYPAFEMSRKTKHSKG